MLINRQKFLDHIIKKNDKYVLKAGKTYRQMQNYISKRRTIKNHGLKGFIIFLIILIISLTLLIIFIVLKYKDNKYAKIYNGFIIFFSITLAISFLAMFGFFSMYRENS